MPTPVLDYARPNPPPRRLRRPPLTKLQKENRICLAVALVLFAVCLVSLWVAGG